MAYRWETPASVWLEQEHNAQFALQSSEGLGRIDWDVALRGRLPDVAHLLGASLPKACRCAPIYPEGFGWCHNCGQPLTKLSGQMKNRPDWWGPWADAFLPRHVPHGLPVTSLALGDSLEERPAAPHVGRFELSMPVPPNAHCVFAAGTFGFPVQRLLALAHKRNVLQYWDPLGLTWQVLWPEEGAASLAFGASKYAWLPALNAARGEVAVVPTESGLQRLFINPISETYRTETVFSGELASSPGIFRRHVACLFRTAAGMRLWTAQSDYSNAEIFECEAPDAEWSRPISYDGRIIWRHRDGQLIWAPGARPQFIRWPEGWTPRSRLGGPTQSRDGRLWVLGHDGQSYSFLELGRETPQRHALDGARLGFANLLFRRGHAVIDEPWEREHVEDPHDDDALVLPLLRSFNNNRSQPSGLVLRFHHYTGKAEDVLQGNVTIARTTLEWIGRRNVILDDIPRLSKPLECVPFVYNDALWLHHPDWNAVRGWRLEELP